MLKGLFLLILLLSSASAVKAAESLNYWLNLVVDGQSMSLPVASAEQCTRALYRYAESNLAHSASCDVLPLPDALNLK